MYLITLIRTIQEDICYSVGLLVAIEFRPSKNVRSGY